MHFFVTYGRGACDFVKRELFDNDDADKRRRLLVSDAVEGKLAFESDESLDALRASLSSVERLFVSLLFSVSGPLELDEVEALIDAIDFAAASAYLLDNNYLRREDDEDENERTCAKRARKTFTYRTNVKTRGSWRGRHDECKKRLVATIGRRLAACSFEPALDTFDLEIACHLSDACVAVGVPIGREPLAKRAYLRHVGLRSTTCAHMIQLARNDRSTESSPCLVVLDPFCGKSTIAAEWLVQHERRRQQEQHKTAAGGFQHLFLIGSDADTRQLADSAENLANLPPPTQQSSPHPINCYDLLAANMLIRSTLATTTAKAALPFKNESVDVIVSDLPFGINHAKRFMTVATVAEAASTDVARFYAQTLAECDRLLVKPNGTAVLLVNSAEADIFERCVAECGSQLHVDVKQALSLGKTSAHLYKLVY